MEKTDESYCFYSDGYNFAFQMGVANYMKKAHIYSTKAYFTGYNFGLLTATALACNISVKFLFKLINEQLEYQRSENIHLNIFRETDSSLIEDILCKMIFGKPDAWKLANNKLVIPVEAINGSIYWIKEFCCNNDIINAVKASIQASIIDFKYIQLDINQETILATGIKNYPVLHPLTVFITCRHKIEKQRFNNYISVDDIEILNPELYPQ